MISLHQGLPQRGRRTVLSWLQVNSAEPHRLQVERAASITALDDGQAWADGGNNSVDFGFHCVAHLMSEAGYPIHRTVTPTDIPPTRSP